MGMLLVTYAKDDIKVAEALRKVIARAGLDARVDLYAKPGRQPADSDRRYGFARDATSLLLINPRPDCDDTQPREAVRALREKHAASVAAGGSPAPADALLCLVNKVAPDSELFADLRAAEADGAVRLHVLKSSLRLPYQHWPATFESMAAVRGEVCKALGVKPPREESIISWKRLRYGPYSRFAVWSAPAVAVILGILGILANVNDSGDLANKVYRWVFNIPPEAGPPELLARYTTLSNIPINITPNNRPPRQGMQVTATAQNASPGRAIYLVSIQPDDGVHVLPISAGGRDDHRAPVKLILDNEGAHTLLLVAVPLGGPGPEHIRDAIVNALPRRPLELDRDVWLRWSGGEYEWRLPDGSKGTPIRSDEAPPADRWAMTLRDAVLAAGGDGTLFGGWSFNVEPSPELTMPAEDEAQDDLPEEGET